MPAPNSQFSSAALDLGLGGQLNQQVQDETDDERRKRMQLMQQQKLGPAGSLAATTLFGGAYGVGTS